MKAAAAAFIKNLTSIFLMVVGYMLDAAMAKRLKNLLRLLREAVLHPE
jgi:hypothetical protein